MTNAYGRLSVTVSTWKKSIAGRSLAWARGNVRHVWLRLEGGGIRWLRRVRRMVAVAVPEPPRFALDADHAPGSVLRCLAHD
jgi:hypothetical protein